jgi:hypothetical protein
MGVESGRTMFGRGREISRKGSTIGSGKGTAEAEVER